MRSNFTLDKYLLKQFFPVFLAAVSMFVFLLLLIDLFANLVRFLTNDVPVMQMLEISLYFMPKCISYATPISLLFAAAYTLGSLYARNELAAIFSSGIPLRRLCASFLAVGILTSLFLFILDDTVVIPTFKKKNELTRKALNQYITESNSDIVVRAKGGSLVYSVDYFDSERNILNGVSIVETDDTSGFVSHIRASSAYWNGSSWDFRNALIYEYIDGLLAVNPYISDGSHNENPDIFRRNQVVVEELPVREAALLVEDLRSAGLPFFQAQANYYQRFSFASTSFIVMILSVSLSGRFKKNVLLMSLFASLSAAVVYYITEMLSMTMAGLNIIHPAAGAWFPIILFVFAGLALMRSAKT